MSRRTPIRVLLRLAAVVLAAGCRESIAPGGRETPPTFIPHPPSYAVTAGSGIALNKVSGSLGESGPTIAKGFNPTNPHTGDAIVATFIWFGSANITRVSDRLTNGTPVGNTYTLVDAVSAGGISMATYVATNAQNFPDAYGLPGSAQDSILVVEAALSSSVTESGVLITAWSGVHAVTTQALGAHSHASGSTPEASPGPVAFGDGSLVYAVTIANAVVGLSHPTGFTSFGEGSDAAMKTDGEYAVQAGAGSVNPQWTWNFQSPSTWLATAVVLNPSGAGGAATHLAFTEQPSNVTAGAAISPPLQVAAQDDAGNTVTSFSGTVTIALGANPGGGTLAGTTTLPLVNGVATFPDLSIAKAGDSYTLVASNSDLTGATSVPFNVTPGPAAQLVFTVQPSTTLPLFTITPAVEVTAFDAFGNQATGFSGLVTIAIGHNGGLLLPGTLSGTKTVAASGGVAIFADLSINQAGDGYTLVVRATGPTGAESAPFNIGAF